MARPAILAVCVLAAGFLRAAEVIPPRPARYFNDYAGVVSPTVADALNRQLDQFERDTTNQLLVAIYPQMQSESSVADYAVRVAQAWGVGQRGRNNGAVLFVFVQDRQMFIKTAYGLEGALPDGICRLIIDRELKPRFRQGDYTGGLEAGVAAIMAATRGEYQGTGRTVDDSKSNRTNWPFIVGFIVLAIVASALSRARQRSAVYQGNGPTWWLGGGGFGGGGGGFGGGGGGGFSGGGGSFGGGGAGGSW
jgi:uncharacterized protein